MKKFILFIIFLNVIEISIAQNWTFLEISGTPIATYYLGDFMTTDISFAINQDTQSKTIEFGIGTTVNGTGWSWRAATFDRQDGSDRYWKYTSDNVVKFTSTGNWYYAGQFIMPTVYYADQGWTENRTTLNATSYFTVNSLSDPSDVGKSAGDGEITINWTKWNSKDVIILRKTSGVFTDPTNGTEYSVSNTIGDATVVYKGSETTFTNTGLSNGTAYTYKIYSNNNNYYSSGTEVEETPTPVQLSSFSANIINKSVNLKWQTATEQNNYGFEIERSQNLVVSSENITWENIGFVNGSGNSNSPKEYNYTDNSINNSGKYSYRLKQVDNNGSYEYSSVVEVDYNPVITFELEQNYPNPFNPTTVINYSLAEPGFVTVKVYNMLGEEVTTLINGQMEAGRHTLQFSATGGASKLSSGMYLYKITAGNFTQVKKMLLTK